MSEAISDRQLVAVLRPFVRACGPVLDKIREAGPYKLGFFTRLRVPGTAAWAAMGPERRTNWWVNRFGRVTAVITAIPGLGGALADRLPVQDLVGVTAQSLVLCAIAGEHGITDTETRVRLIASVLFKRDVDAAPIPANKTEEDAEVARITGQLTPRSIGGTLWRLARSLWAITDELGKRPNGRWYHHLLGLIPVVGVVGDYFGERSGLRVTRKRALRWLREH
jgi:hypothetical protein